MNSVLVILSFGLLALNLSFTSVSAGEMKCKGEPIKVQEMMKQNMKDCLKEVAGMDAPSDPADKDGTIMMAKIPKDKLPCVGKCILQKEGAIDEKGQPCKDKILEGIKAVFPEGVVEELNTAVEKCVDDAKDLDPADETCHSYDGLTQCITGAFTQVCMEKH